MAMAFINSLALRTSRPSVKGPEEGAGPGRLAPKAQRGRVKRRYDILECVGKGTYGKVNRGVEKITGKKVAIKTVNKLKIKNHQELNLIRREMEILSSLTHPHIIRIDEVFENNDKLVIVMEFACNGELFDYLLKQGKLRESEARRFFRQILSATMHCHSNGVVHRDLKLENILLDENFSVKIADFGFSSTYSKESLLHTFCGSPLYAAPEIIAGKPYYGPEVDCWSLGVILYALVYGFLPFIAEDYRTLLQQISHGEYSEPDDKSITSFLGSATQLGSAIYLPHIPLMIFFLDNSHLTLCSQDWFAQVPDLV
uniref:NUAK family SNF1-like kinase 1 isoform X2 n=1 Tax=Myxine glutinosa TaxID=7769 RepID=UPI00358E7FE7